MIAFSLRSICFRSIFSALAIAWLLLVWPGMAMAQGVQPVPALTGHVVDTNGTLSAAELQGLEAKLAAFEREKGSQLAVLVVGTTQPEDIVSYANRVANSWKIGRKGVGDGLLVVVATQDRRMRIEVAKTLEGAIPDLAAKRVIDEHMAVHFKQGNYAAGLNAGADQLMALVRGEALPAARPPAGNDASKALGLAGFQWQDLAVLLFFAVPVMGKVLTAMVGRKAGSVATGAAVGGMAWVLTVSLGLAVAVGLLAAVVALIFGGNHRPAVAMGRRGRTWSRSGTNHGAWNTGGWSGGSSGGSWGGGGGGFSSGGGGDFGGGGASGDW